MNLGEISRKANRSKCMECQIKAFGKTFHVLKFVFLSFCPGSSLVCSVFAGSDIFAIPRGSLC